MKIIVNDDNYQKKLDIFIKNSIREIPRSGMFSALRKGRILLNGKKVKKINEILKVGDTVEIVDFFAGVEVKGNIMSVKMDLKIIYEDQYILVIDKQKGISVHPGAGNIRENTLINGLHYYGNSFGFTPYLTHRLDKFTSGVLIVAKSEEYAGVIGGLFKAKNDIRKFYLAVIFGNPKSEETIDLKLNGQDALTRYKKIRSFAWNDNFINLVEAEIITGRKHQIRRHLALCNLPVAGDDEYGIWALNKAFSKDFRIKEYILHCTKIVMHHPYINKKMEFTAETPKEIDMIFKGKS
jgi:23S rRNA pseudouridine955/2504/2580 synthase